MGDIDVSIVRDGSGDTAAVATAEVGDDGCAIVVSIEVAIGCEAVGDVVAGLLLPPETTTTVAAAGGGEAIGSAGESVAS